MVPMSAEPHPSAFAVAATAPSSETGRIWSGLWIAAGVFAAMLFVRDISVTEAGLSIGGQALWGRDFVNVHSSGLLALQGRLDILYDPAAYGAFQSGAYDGALRAHNYSYPPVTLLYTWLFALLPYPVAAIAWLAGTGALFAAAARPYLTRAGLPAWAALAAPACLVNLWAGHYGFLIGALWLAAFYQLPRRPLLAGILLGLMVVKPHLAVLAPLVLIARRDWSAIAAAAATAGLLIALSAAIFGTDLWVTYLTETSRLQAAMVDDTSSFFIIMMPTVTPALALLGVPLGLATAVQVALAFGAAALLLWKLPRDSMEAGLAAAAATFLVLPYGFAYDMTAAGLGALLLYARACRQSGVGGAARSILLMAALAPMAVMFFNAALMPLTPLLVGAQLLAALALWPARVEGLEKEAGLQAARSQPPVSG
jgi:hypothetical protein